MDELSLYDILGVPQNCEQDEIRVAYRRMAKLHHPDAGGDREMFEEIQIAYKRLSDPKDRKKYDAIRKILGEKPEPREDFGGWQSSASNMTWVTFGSAGPAIFTQNSSAVISGSISFQMRYQGKWTNP